MATSVIDQAALVQAVLLDVDGVLTDGRITYTADGTELKSFHVQDGASIKLLAQHGIEIGIVTGRQSVMVERRANELGINHLVQGAASKPQALAQLCEAGFPDLNICVIGDDLQDLALFQLPAVCLTATVSDAHPAVLAKADFVTERGGGEGVIVELAMLILKAKGLWEHG